MSDPEAVTIDGDTVELRATGAARFFEAAFLLVWIAFWAIGEAVVLAILGSMLGALFGFFRDSYVTQFGRSVIERAPGFEIGFVAVFLFLMAWLSLWTVGGVAAIYTCLRLTGGADRLTVTGGLLELRWRAGPLWRTRRFDRSRMRRIRVRPHDKAVVADMASGTITLTNLGTAAERASVNEWLRRRLGLDSAVAKPFEPLDAPPGWRATRGDAGAIHLARPRNGRSTVAALMAVLTAIALYAWYIDSQRHGPPSLWPGVAIGLLAFAAAWVAWAYEEWIVHPQQLDYRLRFGPLVKERTFRGARLEMTSHTDSDGDTRYKLIVRDDDKKRTIVSSISDDVEVIECARWMEAATGFRLTR